MKPLSEKNRRFSSRNSGQACETAPASLSQGLPQSLVEQRLDVGLVRQPLFRCLLASQFNILLRKADRDDPRGETCSQSSLAHPLEFGSGLVFVAPYRAATGGSASAGTSPERLRTQAGTRGANRDKLPLQVSVRYARTQSGSGLHNGVVADAMLPAGGRSANRSARHSRT